MNFFKLSFCLFCNYQFDNKSFNCVKEYVGFIFKEKITLWQASAGREISVKVLKLRSDHESHISEELFQHAKQKLDVLNQSRRFDNLLVLSPLVAFLFLFFFFLLFGTKHEC